ncbi:peptidyl-tRNA hydrolase 2, mitochondrial [Musca vetustissima]|uniref:peptidyl-tRNA hydrolase 2, mitochondrial n=1 Tax=Musca vetustissima TaxID=27455 RepID=UPI002AB63158|nr:peptidyl-tRNA hydrolase 2, mitochondrial [Musca vetustissima]
MTKLLRTLYNVSRHLTSPPTKLALVVRGDLKMSKGKTAAQCAHAAVICVQDSQASSNEKHRELLRAWLAMGQPKIVLKVDNFEQLIELQKEAMQGNVTAALVQDAGRTQLAAGTATVLGIGPDTVENIDKIVGHLKLL